MTKVHNEHTENMWGWACFTIMVVSIVASVTYYNVTVPSGKDQQHVIEKLTLQYKENMTKLYGVSPAVLECVDRNWSNLSVYQICKEVLANHKLSKEQAEKLARQLQELDR